jgi:hypothetical protein
MVPAGLTSASPGETLAINLMEQLNTDSLVNSGENIDDTDPAYDITPAPLANHQPALLVAMHNDGTTTTRAIFGLPSIPVNVECTGGGLVCP